MISSRPSIGTGLLAVFCDLAPGWLADFRPWLNGDMFPPRRAIGFGPAASFDLLPAAVPVPEGAVEPVPQAHVTIYVSPAPGDLYDRPYQDLRKARAPRDAAFHGEGMINQARYTACWVGPGLESAEGRFAPVLVIDRFDVAAAEAQAFNIWYACEYLPAMAEVPGLARLRRYLTLEGAPSHLLIHEFKDRDALSGEVWLELRRAREWTACRFAPGAPAGYLKVAESEMR